MVLTVIFKFNWFSDLNTLGGCIIYHLEYNCILYHAMRINFIGKTVVLENQCSTEARTNPQFSSYFLRRGSGGERVLSSDSALTP